ncbi:MAG: histidine phosphatase family protein [Thermoanaerobaculia bacterium]
MQLFLVRHGQTVSSRENRFTGSSDPPLTAEGEAMARALAVAYGAVPWSAIYSSPLLRARQTAGPLCERGGVEATLEPGLAEMTFGEWEGLRQEEVRERFPAEFAHWSADVASRGTPGGETAFAVAARAMRVIEQIRGRHAEGNVLVVSHKATLRIITCALLGLDVRLFRERLAQPVAAVTMFDLQPRSAMLTLFCDRSHLSRELREAEGT